MKGNNNNKNNNNKKNGYKKDCKEQTLVYIDMFAYTLTPYETWLLFKEIVIIIIGFLLLLPFSPYVYM